MGSRHWCVKWLRSKYIGWWINSNPTWRQPWKYGSRKGDEANDDVNKGENIEDDERGTGDAYVTKEYG